MKQFIPTLLCLVMLLCGCHAVHQSTNSNDPTVAERTYPCASGKLTAYDFMSHELGRTVKVDIWVKDDSANHPVLYMHDGQNCIHEAAFSHHSWEVDKLFTKTDISSPIVVMIYSEDDSRNADYMPANWWALLPEGEDRITVPGENTITKANSKEYIDFITQTLKPWVDAHYSTRPEPEHTVIAGSSMGALVSLYAVQYRPDIFGCALALSYPSLGEWWNWQQKTFKEQMPEVNSVKLYIDTGTGELDNTFFPYFNDIATILHAAGWDDEHLLTPVFPGADHNEAAWAERLETPMRFAF